MGGRVVFALIAAAVLLEAAPCEGRDVVVLRAHLQFSAAPVAKAPRVIFSLPERDERYSLWLEPEFDVTRHLSSLELVLQKAGSDTAATNMLDPPGHWHGYQKYMFAASDFARGPEQSAYGRTRTMSVKRSN
ncbi:MAG TPA: hypothetical protein VMH36_03775 [Alphaproteobacteria bacterium]|nr:hypothetical protein [Alphaproteobacteria bacterium]